jgi:hypothetical protein
MARIKTSGDWPKLKAKAAPTRHIVAFAKQLAERFNTGSTHDKRRLAVVGLLDRFYEISENEPRFMSDAAKLELVGLSQSFLQLYEKLSREALTAGQRKWKMAAKFHLFQHLCELQIPLYGNARFYWTYSDEDLQRIVKEIALSLHPTTVAHMLLYKWAIVFFDDVPSELPEVLSD